MKVVVTAREAIDKGVWDRFCEIMGLNPWCVNEGMDSSTEFVLTEEQAMQLGFIPRKD